MSEARAAERLSFVAGFVTYVAVGLPLLITEFGAADSVHLILWAGGYLLFGVLFIFEGLSALEVFHERFLHDRTRAVLKALERELF
jgi:hypothetical protein